MTGHICPADHPHACDNAFRRCGMLKEGGFKRLDRPVTIARRRGWTLLRWVRMEYRALNEKRRRDIAKEVAMDGTGAGD